jgi:hypothetical protein
VVGCEERTLDRAARRRRCPVGREGGSSGFYVKNVGHDLSRNRGFSYPVLEQLIHQEDGL